MTAEEYESYLDELNDCIIRTVNGIVEIADKYQLERDVVGKHFTKLFVELTSIATFERYEVKGGMKNET